jgi:YNFM family putative membrane transporter
MAAFLLGAAGMFATMYSTQAILPELGRSFDVTPAEAGLTITVPVLALAAGAWAWGLFSDRYGRKRSIVLASSLLVLPTIAVALAPNFPALLALRGLQGVCMPGLLAVGVPYVAEVFAPQLGGAAMGYYVVALVAAGLIGRLGVGVATAIVGWRWALGALAALPLAAAVIMRVSLPDRPLPARSAARRGAAWRLLRNPELLRAAATGGAIYFMFVGVFSYVVYRLEAPPFGYGTAVGSLVFLLWPLGLVGPLAGRLGDRVGWRSLALGAVAVAVCGLLLSLPSSPASLIVALALVALGNFAGVTAAQLGVASASAVDRGAASAVYFSLYYASGSLGGYLPGLAWEAWHWGGVALLSLGVLASAAIVLLSSRDTASSRPRA